MNTFFKTMGLLTWVMLMLNLSAFAQKGVGDSTGLARSAVQPQIVTLKGSLDHIKTDSCDKTTGHVIVGTHLFINTEDSDLVNVHLGAAYAVESFVNELKMGQIVNVQAFRTEKMGPLEFIAKEVAVNGETLQLRDENLRPIWAGSQKINQHRRFGHHGYRW